MAKSQTIGAGEIKAAIERLAAAISDRHPKAREFLLLGVANGGVELARRLAARLAKLGHRTARAGVLDVSFHRDDIAQHPVPKEFAPTQIPAEVEGATIVLVDDVLFSGRTIKAALDELFDHGRPTKVELAVLVDRGGRRLPVAADYAGMSLAANDGERIVVRLDPADPKRDVVRLEPTSPATQNSPL